MRKKLIFAGVVILMILQTAINAVAADLWEKESAWSAGAAKEKDGLRTATVVLSRSEEKVKEGQYSLKITYSFTKTSTRIIMSPKVSQGFDNLSFWIYGDNSTNSLEIWVGTGTRNVFQASIALDFQQWKKFDIPIKVPRQSVVKNVRFIILNKGGVGLHELYIDNINIGGLGPTGVKGREKAGSKEEELAPTGKKEILQAVDSKSANAVCFKKDILTSLNLISNGSFEEGFPSSNPQSPTYTSGNVGWDFYPDRPGVAQYGEWYEGGAHSGKKCLRLVSKTQYDYVRAFTAYWLPLKPGGYVVQGWYKGRLKRKMEQQQIQVMVFGESVEKISPDTHPPTVTYSFPERAVVGRSGILASSSKWRHFQFAFGVRRPSEGEGEYQVRLKLWMTGKGEAFFDDIVLTPSLIFKVVYPETGKIVSTGDSFWVEVAVATSGWSGSSEAPLLSVKKVSGWKVEAGKALLPIEKVEKAGLIWRLKVKAPGKTGFYPLRVEAIVYGKKSRGWKKLWEKSQFLKVIPPLKNTFAFVAISDTHSDFQFVNQAALLKKEELPAKLTPMYKWQIEAMRTINALQPILTMNIGDIIIPSWYYREDYIKLRALNYLAYKRLFKMPVYTVAGNWEIYPGMYGRAATRWYYNKFAGIPNYYYYDIGNFRFIGLNSAVGTGKKWTSHGGSFREPGQVKWLGKVLEGAKKEGKTPILYFHHPIWGEFHREEEQTKQVTDMIYRSFPLLILNGHHHDPWVIIKKNPYYKGKKPLPEFRLFPGETPVPNPELVARATRPYYNKKGYVICQYAAPLGATSHLWGPKIKRYEGFRYIWIKEGKIAFDDFLPASMKVKRLVDEPGRKSLQVSYVYKKGAESLRFNDTTSRKFEAVPFRFLMKGGKDYRAYLEKTGKELPVYEVSKGKWKEVWVRVNIEPNRIYTLVVKGD